ncbi:Arrestin domain-containing protein 1 [Mactra antiquata]
MGNTRRFEIVIPAGQSVFYPGQVIQGQVCVEIAESMRMRGITISCISSSEVMWRVGKTNQRGVEHYLNLKLTLYGNPPPNGDNVVLPAGSHMFPFQFVLPVNLPGSYEGEPGCYVRHWMTAVIDRPFKFNKEYKMVFTVASILDLNAIPDAGAPLQTNDSKSMTCCCCCYNGEVTAKFRVDKRGFVPGESIAVYGAVTDTSNSGINGVDVDFTRRTVYTAESGAVIQHKLHIGRLHHNQVELGASDIWNGEKLRIPAVPPSYLAGCSIIDIQYYIEIRVYLHCCASDLRLALPLIIGTVPLRETVQQNVGLRQHRRNYQNSAGYTRDSETRAVTNQPQAASASAPLENFDDLEMPPPSYQECVFGKVDTTNSEERFTAGNLKFAPSYTYYDNFV